MFPNKVTTHFSEGTFKHDFSIYLLHVLSPSKIVDTKRTGMCFNNESRDTVIHLYQFHELEGNNLFR